MYPCRSEGPGVGVVVAQLGWHRNCRLLEDSRTLVLGNEGKCLAAGCSREVPLEAPRAKRNRDTARDPGTKTVAVQRHGV
jgi:hypothetical protein